MKSQQGFAVFAGAAWLAAAALSGGFIAAVEHERDTSAQRLAQSSLELAAAPADPNVPEATATQPTRYEGHLYRNGGHYGLKNSDVKLEHQSLELAAAPADPNIPEAPAAQQTPYEGHLYRNGGHYGLKNSDVKLEYGTP